MAMRMFRSMRNPSTMAGRTSNTTGSRIRSSARTIREGTVSLVQKARAKAGGAGYAHGASPDRGLKGSGGQIKQTAANQSKKAGATLQQTRQNTVAALKSAKAPAGYGLMNRAGYNIGTRSVARAYKSNVKANNPGQRTGLESRTELAAQRASAVVSSVRAGAVKRGNAVASAVNRGTSRVVNSGASLGMRAERVVSAVGNAPRAALQAAGAKGKTFGQGVRIGSRMPDANMKKVYNAQRYADPNGVNKSVTLASRPTALTTAAGYGVGKAARRTVQGVNAIQDAPGKAVRSLASTSRKVAGGLMDAAKNNRLSLNTQNALHNIVRPGVKNAVEKFNLGAEKVYMGIGKTVGYVGAAPSLAVYYGGKALINGVRANVAAAGRMKATSAAAMKSPRMTRAAGFGQAGRFTPMGNHSIVQAVRIQNVQNGGVWRGQKPKSKPWNLSSNGTVGGSYNPNQPVTAGKPHSLRPQAPSVQLKTASSSKSFMGQASGSGQSMVGTPRQASPLTKNAPWERGASGSLTMKVGVKKSMAGRYSVNSPEVKTPATPAKRPKLPLPGRFISKDVINQRQGRASELIQGRRAVAALDAHGSRWSEDRRSWGPLMADQEQKAAPYVKAVDEIRAKRAAKVAAPASQSEPTADAFNLGQPKKGRGRPKGSPNKPKANAGK